LRAAKTFLRAGLDPVIVVVSNDEELLSLVSGLPVQVAINPTPSQGIASSIRRGVQRSPADVDAVLIGVADQPLLDEHSLRSLIAAFRANAIVVPRYGSFSGNPRVFDRRFFGELESLTGDRGGQLVCERHGEAVIEVSLPEKLAVDIDRRDDWELLED
jgi:CTP:molybdopterin cytidylyltransferase MocA